MLRIAIAATLWVALANAAFAQTAPAIQPDKNTQRTTETSMNASNKPDHTGTTSTRGSGSKKSARPNWGQQIRHRRRPHLHAIPRS
jgi:hypothetical protein